MPITSYLATIALSYFLGSIPFGYLLVRLFHGEDVRASGSGNIGATNVARTSFGLGIVTLLLDASKGLAAVLLARTLFAGPGRVLMMSVAALFAVVGHMFPVWLKFRGGKGVATGLGSFAVIAPKSMVCMVCIFLMMVIVFRHVSLGSIVAAMLFPVVAWWLREYVELSEVLMLATASLLIVWKHRQNIRRLLAGTESKLGGRHS